MTPVTAQSVIKASKPEAMRRSEAAGVTLRIKWTRASFEKHMLRIKKMVAAYCD